MFTKTFFKIFPPPRFLNVPYAGIDISDDAVRCVEYSPTIHGYKIHKYGMKSLPVGTVESGNIKDEKTLIETISYLAKELKIHTVKASLPEERMYLFKKEVPVSDERQIRQNLEFKLEENVPLSPADAVFFFDVIPKVNEDVASEGNFVSVSVAPRELVNNYLNVLRSSGLSVISFEIQAKAIARVSVPKESKGTQMIVHIMNKKTGIYIVYQGVLCFTSTIPWGGEIIRGRKISDLSDDIFFLRREIEKAYTYWAEYGEGKPIESIILSGHDALVLSQISHISPNPNIPVEVANIWQNVFSNDHYIAPIVLEDSLDYVISAGLALP